MGNGVSADFAKRLKQREDMFLRRLFGMLAKMAKADGKVDAWETHAAEGAFARFPRAAARRKFCVRVFNESKKSRISLYRQAWEFSNKWGASSSDCLAVYELLWDIACSTGFLKPVHKSNLSGICKYLNLPEAYFNIYFRKRSGTFREWSYSDQAAEEEAQRAKRKQTNERKKANKPPPRPKSSLQKAYELIGCSSDADDAAVRRAYRLAAKKCHPDILRASGASEEGRVAAATEQMAQINDAWDTIRKARGM